MLNRLKAMLLHYANASPPSCGRAEFYAVKDKLLQRYAASDGVDVQEISKPCYGELHWYDEGEFRVITPCGKDCHRCGGTGIYDIRWVALERFRWYGRTYHIPRGDTRIRPEKPADIVGLVKHTDYGKGSDEARLWLYLLCGEWRLLWQQLRASYYCGWHAWPLLNLQWVVFKWCLFWNRRILHCTCCGRRFLRLGRYCPVCRKCQRLQTIAEDLDINELPF